MKNEDQDQAQLSLTLGVQTIIIWVLSAIGLLFAYFTLGTALAGMIGGALFNGVTLVWVAWETSKLQTRREATFLALLKLQGDDEQE